MATQPSEGSQATSLSSLNQILKDFGTLITTAVGIVGGIVLFWKEVLTLWTESSPLVRILVFGVIGLLTVFAIYAQVIVPWLERRRRQRMIALVETDDPAKPVSFRLRPYEEADHDVYDRPDGVHEKAATWLEGAKATCLYLTGTSGAGKSSLLQAWLIPELADATRPVRSVVVRSFADPVGQLVQALKAEGAVPVMLPEDETDPRALLELAAGSMRVRNGRLLIAIDQFEECLILQDEEAKARLAELFRDLQERPIERLQLLFVLGFDYLNFDELTALGLPDPRPRENWFMLEALSHADARTILRRALPGMDPGLEDKVIEEASDVDNLPGLIRPITLNMMGLILKNFAGAALTRATPGRLIQDFLKRAMVKPGIDALAPKLLAEMITDKGTKRPMGETELAEAAGVERALTRKTLYLLGEEGVVRELDRARHIWEISHDFVARQLGQIIPRLKPSLWRRAQRAATPIAITAWLLILFAGYPAYEAWRDARIADVLRAEGVSVFGEPGSYEIVFDPKSKTGAIERVFDYVEALRPVALTIRGDDSIARIPSLEGLRNLEEFEIWHSDQVPAIEGLKHLRRLKRLHIEGNDGLTVIDGLDGLTALEKLHIEGNGEIEALLGLAGMRRLEEVRLEDTKITDLSGLENLARLRLLDLSDNGRLTSLPSLENLAELQELVIFKNRGLATLTGLEGLESLEKLQIYKNDSLEAVDGLRDLERLKSLIIRFNDKLVMEGGLAGLTALEELHIEDNLGPISLASLKDSENLRRVRIWGNELKDMPRFGDFPNLKHIALDGLDIASSIEALKDVRSSVEIRASHRYLNTGYAEKLNEARRNLGLDRLHIRIDEQL